MRLLFLLFVSLLLTSISCSSSDNKTFELNITPIPAEAGMVTPANGDFEADRTLEISATPNEHWVFSRWEGDYEGSQNPVVITLDSDKDIAAFFEKRDYLLTLEIVGEGTVTERIVQQKTTEYPHGTVVELTADPEDGWEFTGWEGALDGDENPATITIDGETEITAVFSRIEYPLTINIVGQGSVKEEIVQAKTTDYPEGTVVELTAEPDDNWMFSEWEGDIESSQNPVTITIDEPKEVTVTFLRTYRLTTIAEPEEGGVITPDDTVFVRDTDIKVEAIPNAGWRFVNWEGDFTGSVNPFNLTMNGNKTIVGNFEREIFQIDLTEEGEGSVTIDLLSGTALDGGFLFESEVELTAVPDDGWEFKGWEGYVVTVDNPIQITVSENIELTALFEGKAPEVSTDTVTNITDNSADVTGTLIDANNFPITERGVCYSDSENPGLSFGDCETAVLDGNETFSVTLNNLDAVTTYYVRAYATSESGTGYGEQISFQTKVADIDGNVYAVTQIGGQLWMAENLRAESYENGEEIPQKTTNFEWITAGNGGWSYYGSLSSNNNVYGKIYNGYAALDDRNICPAGWHVPTDDDWKDLELHIEMPAENVDEFGLRGEGQNVGGKLKAAGVDYWQFPNSGADNESGFTALPGGYRLGNGNFEGQHTTGSFWSSSSINNESSVSRSLTHNSGGISRDESHLNIGFSVRCVQD